MPTKRSEQQCIRKLYDEHEKTLRMIDRDLKYYNREIDYQKEANARAVNFQTRLETLKEMKKLIDDYMIQLDTS